jgi:hypothetical protein
MNYNQIQTLLAFYLDKLKVSNPVLYVLSQAAMLLLLYLFGADKININDTVDAGVIFILGSLLTTVSPRTSQRASDYKKRTGATKVESEIESGVPSKVEPSNESEDGVGEPSEPFPDIDQSNN